MNREQAKALLPIIQAFSDGKEIQYWHHVLKQWMDCCGTTSGPIFSSADKYRIKPEKKTGWILIHEGNSVYNNNKEYQHTGSIISADRKTAIENSGSLNPIIACIQIEYYEGQGLE